MTYRVGNHQPRNLYRDNEYIGVCFDPADTALIAAAMEGTSDDYRRGARDALTAVRRRIDAAAETGQWPGYATFERMLRNAAAELGVDQDGPRSPLSVPVAAEQGAARGLGRLSDTIIERGPFVAGQMMPFPTTPNGHPIISAAEFNELRDELIAARAAIELLRHLTDPDPCQLDHNGFCQAHYATRDGQCDHARAKELLAEVDR